MSGAVQEPGRKSFMDLLASEYKQEVLEQLLDNPDYLFTVNELADRVSGSYNSVSRFLRDLEMFDIVKFQKKGGSYLIRYKQDSRYHEAIKTLFRADNAPLEEASEKFAKEFYNEPGMKEKVSSITLFGSVARGTAGPNSDIDVLILVESEPDVEAIKQKARNRARELIEYELVPVVETVKEFKENLKDGKRFETNVKKDGIVLQGGELEFES